MSDQVRHRADGWGEIGRGGVLLGERTFLQEPIFAAKPGGNDEDDGYVLIVANHAGEDLCRLHIFDAKKIGDGPVASVELEDHLPPGLHGYWSNAVHK